MAMNDMQRLENIYGSIRKYAKASLVTAKSLSVSLDELVDVDFAAASEWVELRFLRLPHVQTFRKTGTNTRGSDSRILVQLNVFVRKTSLAVNFNTRRSQEIIDIIDEYFHEGISVPVYQLQSGGTPATKVGDVKVVLDNVVDLGEIQRSSASSTMAVFWRAYEAVFKWDRLTSTV